MVFRLDPCRLARNLRPPSKVPIRAQQHRHPTTQRHQTMTTPTTQDDPSLSLLSPQQVQQAGLKNFKVLDASFHLPNSARSAFDEFKTLPRIPSSRFFDHELVADSDYTIDNPHREGPIKLAHMQPGLATFKRSMESLGIYRNHHVLVYDSVGIFSSPRAAWLLNAYGHPKVSVLDGGLPRWIKENGPLESEPSSIDQPSEYELSDFEEDRARHRVISYAALVQNYKASDADHRLSVLDARPRGRFLGTDPEPRPGISSGHIPHSISLPFTDLLTAPRAPEAPYQMYLSPDELEKVFLDRLGNDHQKWQQIKRGERGLVVSCGSGMTACVLWLALRLCGAPADRLMLYDESWTGYALRHDAVILKSTPS